MKCVCGLSTATLMSFVSIVQPGVAMSKVAEQVDNQTLSAQAEPVMIANIFRVIQKGVQTLDQLNQLRLQEQCRQKAEQRRQELEVARREATEQQRLKAELCQSTKLCSV